jgi:hypothetical protein
MKLKIVLSLAALMCLQMASFAQTRLSVTMVSDEAIRIGIDEREYSCQGNTLTVENLSPGYHVVKVIPVVRSRTLPFNNRILLKAGVYTDVVINRFGKSLVDEQQLAGNYNYTPPPPPPQQQQQQFTMTDDNFARAREAIRRESFDNNKMTVAKQVADNNYFTTTQAKELVKLFSFEDAKLEYAKYVYSKTIDKNNYFVMNEVFNVSRSKEELANYIKNYR